jgi:hypothetical protein
MTVPNTKASSILVVPAIEIILNGAVEVEKCKVKCRDIQKKKFAAVMIRRGPSPPSGSKISNFPQKLCHFVILETSGFAKMRLAHRLLMATPASIGSKSSLSEALALLPPLQLYRRILRVHRKLDPEMRVLGDSYVKKEFRAHRTAENPLHIVRLLC